jgi:hypothetical protein
MGLPDTVSAPMAAASCLRMSAPSFGCTVANILGIDQAAHWSRPADTELTARPRQRQEAI